MSAEQFPTNQPKGGAEMRNGYINQQTLDERLQRVRHYQQKMPGTGNRDAVNAVLANDYRGRLSEEKQRERSAYARALLREIGKIPA